MFSFLNQYSFVIGFVILFVAAAGFLPMKRWRTRLPVYAGAIVAALVIYVLLRPGASSVSSSQEANQLLSTSGQPVFVEFFSNTCVACLASKPFVDKLKSDLAGDVVFVQLNVQDSAAQPLMRQHNVLSTPTFLGFDPGGELVYRQSGILNAGKAKDALLSPT